MDLYHYTGCLHIHLKIDGKKEHFDEIISGAKEAGLNFFILTPHTPHLRNSTEYFSIEGYKDGVLFLAGEEADEKTTFNHLLLYGKKQWQGKQDVEKIINLLKENSCLSFAAHPDGKHRLFGFQTDHRWTKRHLLEFLTGVEVWSLLFDFASKTNPANAVFRYAGFPLNLKGPSNQTLNLWDKIAARKRFTGVAGLDIHPLRYGMEYLDIMNKISYKNVFKTLRNHILCEKKLSGDSIKDIETIVDTFRKARLFFSNDFLADSTGFFFGSEDRRFISGDKVKKGESLLIEVPEKADIFVKNSGFTEFFKDTAKVIFKAERPGPCRVEVYYRGKPWIFSNHIYVE